MLYPFSHTAQEYGYSVMLYPFFHTAQEYGYSVMPSVTLVSLS